MCVRACVLTVILELSAYSPLSHSSLMDQMRIRILRPPTTMSELSCALHACMV